MAGDAEIAERRRVAEQIVALAQLESLMLATAQSRLPGDPKAQQRLDYFLYQLRPPALWNEKHPAWTRARSVLLDLARVETSRWVKGYSKTLRPITLGEVQNGFTPPEAEMLRAFAESPGGKAWFERRLAEVRLKNGDALFEIAPDASADRARRAQEAHRVFEALPAAERQKIESFVGGAQCSDCARPPAKVMEDLISRQADWLVEVFANQLTSIDWRVVEIWKATLNEKLGSQLPVDSKKQVLGVLEMGGDASLHFRFHFYWKDKADGGAQTLEFRLGHPNYAEVLALAPGLSTGQSRPLYRDADGVISDLP